MNKPLLANKYIIVMMPGDAPDSNEKIRYFTKDSATKLFQDVYKLWEDKGKEHKIIIENSPRTGKFDPNTGALVGKHEYIKGQNPEVAVDKISKYFVSLFKDIDHQFFNFAFEIDGEQKRTISVFNPLLYLANQGEDNIFILPGSSVSLMAQIPLYLPTDRIILFKTSSMNEDHENIFNAAFNRNYLSYFNTNGEVVMPGVIEQRMEDDSLQIARDISNALLK